MRWFKHLSQASEDEKLSEILELHGTDGYGMYWLILEKIAFLMERGSDRTKARYSVKKWAKFCGKSPKVFRKFLKTFQELSLFSVEICQKNSDFLIIDCPNLLKYRDEYTKKSGQSPDNVPSDSGQTPDQETETETETDITYLPQNEFAEDDNEEEFYLTKKKRKLSGKRLSSFILFWETFDYKKDKANAADSWLDIPKLTNQLVETICKSAKIEAENRPEIIKSGRTPIYAQGWISSRRWEDEELQESKDGNSTAESRKKATDELLKGLE